MKKRVRVKINSLRPKPSKMERMFNAARGYGQVVINHGENKLVMIKAEKYEEMQREIESLQAKIQEALSHTPEDHKKEYQDNLSPSRKKSEGGNLPR